MPLTTPSTTALHASATTHTLSFISAMTSTSPSPLSPSKLASSAGAHFHPNITSFQMGHSGSVDRDRMTQMIQNTFDRFMEDGGVELEAVSHKVDTISEGSAMVTIVWQRREVSWRCVYFFRVMEDGTKGWEGGVFDGELWHLRQLDVKLCGDA